MILVVKETFYFLQKSFVLGQILCWHPFTWNKQLHCPEFTKSNLQIYLWCVNAAFTFGYFAYVVAQCLRTSSSSEETVTGKVFLRFFVIFLSFPVAFQLNTIFSMERYSGVVQCFLQYQNLFEEKYVVKHSGPTNIAKMFHLAVKLVYYALWLNVVMFLAVGTSRQSSPEQLYSLLPPAYKQPFTMFLSVLLWVHVMLGYGVNAIMTVIPCFVLYATTFQILKELGRLDSTLTKADLQQSANFLRVYRALQIQFTEVNRAYFVVTPAAKIILCLFAIFSMYGSIRLSGILVIALSTLGGGTVVYLGFFANAWAELHSRSRNAIARLQAQAHRQAPWDGYMEGTNKKWVIKNVRSLQVLKIGMLGLHHGDKALVLNIVKIVSEGTMFLLVNF